MINVVSYLNTWMRQHLGNTSTANEVFGKNNGNKNARNA